MFVAGGRSECRQTGSGQALTNARSSRNILVDSNYMYDIFEMLLRDIHVCHFCVAGLPM